MFTSQERQILENFVLFYHLTSAAGKEQYKDREFHVLTKDHFPLKHNNGTSHSIEFELYGYKYHFFYIENAPYVISNLTYSNPKYYENIIKALDDDAFYSKGNFVKNSDGSLVPNDPTCLQQDGILRKQEALDKSLSDDDDFNEILSEDSDTFYTVCDKFNLGATINSFFNLYPTKESLNVTLEEQGISLNIRKSTKEDNLVSDGFIAEVTQLNTESAIPEPDSYKTIHSVMNSTPKNSSFFDEETNLNTNTESACVTAAKDLKDVLNTNTKTSNYIAAAKEEIINRIIHGKQPRIFTKEQLINEFGLNLNKLESPYHFTKGTRIVFNSDTDDLYISVSVISIDLFQHFVLRLITEDDVRDRLKTILEKERLADIVWTSFDGRQSKLIDLDHQHLSNIFWWNKICAPNVKTDALAVINLKHGGVIKSYQPNLDFKDEIKYLEDNGYLYWYDISFTDNVRTGDITFRCVNNLVTYDQTPESKNLRFGLICYTPSYDKGKNSETMVIGTIVAPK
jgi:hypothetical protein